MAVTWKRNAGRIMLAGDSIVNGADGYTGGWRKKVLADLATAGIAFSAVGPYTTNSPGMAAPAHRGLNGDSVASLKTTIGAQCVTYAPTLIVLGIGSNDIGSGSSTSSVFLTDLDAAIDAIQSNAAAAVLLVNTLVLPEPGDEADYYDHISEYNAANAAIGARVAAQGATLVNVGQPVLGDGLHPIDGATGYDSMATPIYNAILAAIA